MGVPAFGNRTRGGQDPSFLEICTTFYRLAKGPAKCQLAQDQLAEDTPRRRAVSDE